ncbi:MAG: ATP-binding protein [Aminivibrio sp.]|uniref:tRNA 2-thiocytidine biosynthesis TtcA family protein n=1 Tax=Aminivibrio sp. TaxID=1872489 RepID=UPI002B1F2655|nr:ATP-binding protein [Aminivibrio sp.]MEA4953601.1 ATP-binding protein [Aminivibrio sp.]
MTRSAVPVLSLSLRKKIGLAAGRFRMIAPGDRIMIGLSGGKDSLVLALALAGLRRRSPVPFSLAACFVDITGGHTEVSSLRKFCDSLDIPFFVRPHPIVGIIEVREERSPCSLCANIRRGILNTAAKEDGCNLLALGHNLDDVVETALMNLFHTGRFRAFQPKFRQSRTGMTVIRPLVFAEERKIGKEARRLGLPVLPYVCPFSLETERVKAKSILDGLSAGNPRIKYNILHALQCLDERDKWSEGGEDEVSPPSGDEVQGEMTWEKTADSL